MFFEKNFATKEQMERLNKLFYFPGNIIICDYNLSLLSFIFKGIYCLIKYEVVELGKHGR